MSDVEADPEPHADSKVEQASAGEQLLPPPVESASATFWPRTEQPDDVEDSAGEEQALDAGEDSAGDPAGESEEPGRADDQDSAGESDLDEADAGEDSAGESDLDEADAGEEQPPDEDEDPAEDEADSAGEPDPDEADAGEGQASDDGVDPAGEVDADSFVAPPTMSQMLFVDVLVVLPSSNPVIVLQEADSPYRELRIPIGGPEGIAIGYAARRIATPRPLTHELMTLLLRDFDLTLEVVRITGSSGGSFTAEIVVSGATGARTIDCRPSDAIALALRQRLQVPILALPEVLDQAGSGAAGSN